MKSAANVVLYALLTLLCHVPSRADEPSLDSLQKQVNDLTLQLQRLAPPPSTPWTPPPIKPPTTPAPEPAKPTFPNARLTGFFQADAGWFDQGAFQTTALVDGNPVGDIQDGADFRRARLAAVGDLTANSSYIIEMDFAFPGRPSFMDVWTEVKDTCPLGTVRVGQWRQPISMDAQTSVRDMPFLERALPFSFVPFRQIGAGVYNHSEEWDATWAASVFRTPTDIYGGNIGDNGGYAMASRWTCVPLSSDDDQFLLHVGGGIATGDPSNDVVRFRNQPEINVSEIGGVDILPPGVPNTVPLLVDTGLIPTNYFRILGAELAGTMGSAYFQSEALFTHVDRKDGGNNDFWGAYAQVGYYLTGEVRPYLHNSGVFGRITPLDPVTSSSGWGAWEVVARYSYIDLTDGPVQGNQLAAWSAGVNWYLNRNLKWQTTYSRSTLYSLNSNPLAPGATDLGVLAIRIQADF